MRRLATLVTALCVLAAAPAAFAEDVTTDLNVEARERLCEIKTLYQNAEQLRESGVISTEMAGVLTAHYIEEAREVSGMAGLTGEQLTNVTPPGAWDRFVGWTNLILWIAVAALVACILIVAFRHWLVALVEIFANVPVEVWETLLGLGGVGLVVWGYFLNLDAWYGEWVGLTGCLLAAGAMLMAYVKHELDKKSQISALFGAIAILSGIAAVAYGSTMIGYLSIAALMSALGFSVIVLPGCWGFGFDDDAAVSRGTTTGLLMVVLYAAIELLGTSAAILAPFKSAALFFGSFVGFLGLLIVSSKWYSSESNRNGNYFFMQLIAIGCMVGATFLGTVFGIESLQPVGGTFLMFYLSAKLIEIPTGDRLIGFAYRGILASGFIVAVIWLARANPETIGPYLVF
ncbi:hypothetical protein ACFL26_00500 [Patescibacteria group bacterium]